MGTPGPTPASRLKWVAALLACLAIPLVLIYSKQPGGGGGGASDVCFARSDFDVMFTARVSHPDPQLSDFLRDHKIHAHYPSFDELLHAIYHTNRSVYADFTLPAEMPEAPYYSGQTSSLTTDFLAQLHPEPIKLMVEVGSFVGSSARNFGKFLKATGNGVLLCIDTWNGEILMIMTDYFIPHMGRAPSGESRLYYRFLNTMIKEALTTTVMPLRVSSISGARIIKTMQYTVDAIYLDSAHEYGETWFELMLFWEVLKPGGVLFGDDYDFFPAVKHDVDLFVAMKGLPPPQFPPHELKEGKRRMTWFLVKPL